MDQVKIRRAILSVYDKSGIERLGKALAEHDVYILSTGGTGRALTQAGIPYQEVSEYTGSPEMLGGRVKTLHPYIHGGLLFKREDAKQAIEAENFGIKPIDLVAVNLYPFEQTVAKSEVTLGEAMENVDIGGPTMIRSGSKNFQSVAVITDPSDYNGIIEELREGGSLSFETRKRLAVKAFQHTSDYDSAIVNYLSKQ